MSKDSANNSQEKQAEQIISTWDSLALAYDRLLEKHSIFSVMASRLIELANATSCESVMDLAGGSGLLSKMLLSASAKTKIYFVEPAPQMMTLAKQQLDPAKTIFYQAKATEIDKFDLKVDAILSNAAMHLVDLEKVFKSVSTVLEAGGIFIFNLWWHAFEETAQEGKSLDWRPVLEKVLKEYNEEIPKWSNSKSKKPYSREMLRELATRSRLKLERVILDRDPIDRNFFIDFMSMYPDLPKAGLGDKRSQIIQRAKEICTGKAIVTTVRFLFRKT